ncbi:TPA: bifunctional threonine ammonia-lyase/L-serine ammonia-lyase TdcB [Escherichia coli]
MHITYDLPVAIDDIIEAKQRLAGRIYKTGMPRSNYFSERCKGEIFLKFENMQRTGSFKIRGAFNKLSSLTDAEKRKGVVACSAGNHAQGVSLSCAMLGIDGKVVMPKGAPKSKVAATCDYSAEVVLHGDNFNDTIAKVSEIVEMEGRIFIPPYDDPKVIAGQGTIGLEIMEDLYDVDNVIVPIGGGGLIAGIAVAIKSINPTIRVIGVQSENVHGMAASFHSGEITTHRTTSGSGNQGITATMPVVVVAEHFGADDERLARALMLSHLSAIYIHNQLPRLSALCAATTAAMGAAAGMAWLVDGRYETISMAISSMIGDVSGMICDGASNSCAMKVSTSASAAWKAVLMALDDTAVTGNEGIVAHDVEQSIANLCALASHSMQQTDRQIIEIMASKAR